MLASTLVLKGLGPFHSSLDSCLPAVEATRPHPSHGHRKVCEIRGMPGPPLPSASILSAQEALPDPKTTHFLTCSRGVSPWSLNGNMPPAVAKTWMASDVKHGGQDL